MVYLYIEVPSIPEKLLKRKEFPLNEEQVKAELASGETAMWAVFTLSMIVLVVGIAAAAMIRIGMGNAADAALFLLGTIAIEIVCLVQAIFCRHWVSDIRSYNLERTIENQHKPHQPNLQPVQE